MKSNLCMMMATAGVSLLAVGAANAADVNVSGEITTSTTWTKNNVYKLQGQVYVRAGATLTIEPGTLIASRVADGGSLAICQGARIVAEGTQAEPIIFTSEADVATWTAGNPKTGSWRVSANEWGNITIMGRAYISENAVTTNTAAPNANNIAIMEGLTGATVSDVRVIYGGGDDDDNSGSLKFVSLRYGGKVIGLNNELNGLSLGGIGRGTVIENLEIMNNVDDGIEIWGGTVNLKNFSIWNIGDDSFDIDQGWRGKGQFGLIVQGYSLPAAQGSGVGDNALEFDGAENSDFQPVTTAVLYNLTVIGDRGTTGANGCDHGIAYRDGARLQVRQSIFMDLGERLVQNDNVDGDGGSGYGFNGTLAWANTWTTAFNVFSTVNAPANPAAFYTAQVDGNLNEIKDSVFFNNTFGTAYTEADARGVRNAANNNVTATSKAMPIVSITRGPTASPTTTLRISPVTNLDPRAANNAVTSVGTAPNDGFFTPVTYRGAFSPTTNWLCDWTAADAFGMTNPTAGQCPTTALPCPADFNDDNVVDSADLGTLLSGWGTASGDISGNGTTDSEDLGILLSAWGNCP
jgi:hypothetical protein